MSREPTIIDTTRIRTAIASLQAYRPHVAVDFRTPIGGPLLAVFTYDRDPRQRGAVLINVERRRFNSVPELLRWVRLETAKVSEAETQTLRPLSVA